MEDTIEGKYIELLQDAFALETNIIQILEAQIKLSKDYPRLTDKLTTHLETTKRHKKDLASVLANLGVDESEIKSALSNILAKGTSGIISLINNSILSTGIIDYGIENMGIALYTILSQMAIKVEDTNGAKVIDQILKDKDEMNAWLKLNFPMVTDEYMKSLG